MSLDFIGGIFQAAAQDKATDTNARNVQQTNTQNLLLSIMSRGGALTSTEANQLGVPELAGQSSAILPYYLSDVEKATGANAGALALALQKAAPTVGDYQGIVAGLQPAMNNARDIGNSVLSGQMTKDMLAQEQPVAGARLDVAEVQKNAALQQLDKTLNDIDNIQARKGYSGDSYGNRMLKFNARAGIMSTAAANTGQAKLQNALETQAIQGQGRNLQLANLGLPASLASNEIAMKDMPVSAASRAFGTTMQPLSSFNIGNHAFNENNLPLVDKTSQTGLAISGLAGAGNSGLNYGLQRYFQSLNNSQTPNSGSNLTPAGSEGGAGNFGSSFGGSGGGADYGGEMGGGG